MLALLRNEVLRGRGRLEPTMARIGAPRNRPEPWMSSDPRGLDSAGCYGAIGLPPGSRRKRSPSAPG